VDEAESRSCQMAGFGISGVEPSGFIPEGQLIRTDVIVTMG
jgi:hypothetical protein